MKYPSRIMLVLLILLTGEFCQASDGKISADLDEVLGRGGNEAPVIIFLKDQVPVREYSKSSRAALIRALKENAKRSQGKLTAVLRGAASKNVRSLWMINGISVVVPSDLVYSLEQFSEVDRIVLDYPIQLPPSEVAQEVMPEWNLQTIGATDLWSLGYQGEGVVIAGMDSGVDANHPDLKDRWRGGLNSWYDPNGEHSSPYDADGHGTQTMSIMVGGDYGGSAIGVAPGAQWIAVKIFNDSSVAALSVIHDAFQWLLDPDGDPDTDDAPDVVNVSWGLSNVNACSLEFQLDILTLKVANIALSFAAGNSGPDSSTSISPANNFETLAVGAVDQSLSLERTSSRGPSACDTTIYPELVAPGVKIRAADLTGGGAILDSFVSVSGTSFAAPHAAGAMALLLSAYPLATVAELETALKSSAADLGELGPDNDFGNGLLNGIGAYRRLLRKIPDTVGVRRQGASTFYLRNSNSSGFADIVLEYGLAPDLPVTGDWDGDGIDTVGVFRDGVFYLSNSNLTGMADVVIVYGMPGDFPVVGDWDGDGIDTIGVYRDGTFLLRNENSSGIADIAFAYGIPGDIPLVGDWNGDGVDTIGIFRDSVFFLRNVNSSGSAELIFAYGAQGDEPLCGDWNGDGVSTIGVHRDDSFYLRNSNDSGFADISFTYGVAGDKSVTGNWKGVN